MKSSGRGAGVIATDYEITIHGWRARVSGPPSVLSDVRALFPGHDVAAPDAPLATTFEIREDAERPGSFQILQDGALLREGTAAECLLPTLESITAAAIAGLEQTGSYLFHAGAVMCSGRALIAPAASGVGKTSLVLGLVHAGYPCFTDEVTIVDPSTLRVLAFRKSMCLKETTRAALAPFLADLGPLDERRRPNGDRVWYCTPPDGSWAQTEAPVGWVVLPRHTPCGRGGISRIARSAALARLLEQTFTVAVHRPPAFQRVITMVRDATCFEMTYRDVEEAVELIATVADR